MAVKSGLPQKLFKNDIVFNPYRINTGSVIYIDSDDTNLITSPAYVVIRNIDMNIKYLVQMLKTPFMKYQIQVLASGSVRDNFSGHDLYSLKIPQISKKEQDKRSKKVSDRVSLIFSHELETDKLLDEINEILTDF